MGTWVIDPEHFQDVFADFESWPDLGWVRL
jgi:hypothetical protein